MNAKTCVLSVLTVVVISGSVSAGASAQITSVGKAVDSAVENGDNAVVPPAFASFAALTSLFEFLSPQIIDEISAQYEGSRLISHVDKQTFQGKSRYLVTPAPNAGEFPMLARWAAWHQVIANGVPAKKTLRNQFLCHYDVRALITWKPTWNLEASRPDRGYQGFVLHWCN